MIMMNTANRHFIVELYFQSKMDNSTQISNTSELGVKNEDFFEELYSDTNLKRITIIFFFAGTILSIIFETGIIWYERNGDHSYRTVLNQLFSTISWFVICYTFLVYIPEGIRYLIGPLNQTWCGIHTFVKNFLVCCFLLASDSIVSLRYLLIFKWTRISVFDDNFLATFLQLSILVVSSWMTLIEHMSTRNIPLNYYLCTGKVPPEHSKSTLEGYHPEKYNTTVLIVFVSFLLHVFTAAKIFFYQRKLEKLSNNIELGQLDGTATENDRTGNQRRLAWGNNQPNQVRKTSNISKSMADLTTQLLCLTFLLAVSITDLVMNKTKPTDLNQYRNRWLVYFNHVLVFSFGAIGICGQYYARNTAMRNAIWRNIRNMIQIK